MRLTLPPSKAVPRLIVFGIDCHFTDMVLRALVQHGLTVAGLVLPGPPESTIPRPVRFANTGIPLALGGAVSRSVSETAHAHDIPTFRFGRLTSPESLTVLNAFDGDFLICACYPRLIPSRVTRMYPGRALNVHPSLLPSLRGPDPLFWTFREGSGSAGITIHDLSPRLDAGAIVAQEAVPYPDGATETELETILANRAGDLLLRVFDATVRGGSIDRREQDDSAATYAPFPGEGDFTLDRSMSARAAYNFVRGIESRGTPITVEYQGRPRAIRRAVAYTTDRSMTRSDEGLATVQLRDGYLIAEIVLENE